jgi:RNA polymerase sigma factor (sigma-70 family)
MITDVPTGEKRATWLEAAFPRGIQQTARFLQSLGASVDIAEESAQAAWVRAWECRSQLRKDGSVNAWVNSIAKNIMKESIRVSCKSAPLNDHQLSSPRALTSSKLDSLLDLRSAMRGERRNDSAVLRLFYDHGYATHEIATLLNMTPTAVRIRLFRGRQRIKERMAITK